MKTTSKKVLLGATTILAMGIGAHSANAATTGVPMQAIILDPVEITQTRVLNFGSLTENALGTAVVDNADAISVTGGVTSIGGTIQAGGFSLNGAAIQIDITGPAAATVSDGAGNTMSVSTFTIDGGADINGAAFTHTLATAGVAETGFRVGGTLNVGAGQAAGTYNGTVTLTANYN